MMRLLRGNVTPHGRRGAYGKRRITLLPCESAIKIPFSPRGRFLLQVAKYIGNAVHWPETSQDMDMIFNAADNLGHAVHTFNDPAEVRMKTRLPVGLDEGSPLFGREDDVIVQAEEG